MKKVLLSLGLVLFVFGSAQAANLKIGVVDVRSIVTDSPEVKTIQSKLEKTFKPRQIKILDAQKALQADVDKLNRDSSVMSKSNKDKLQQKIIKAKRDLDRTSQDYQQDLQRERNKQMQAFFQKVKNAIDNLAKRGSYDLIVQKDVVPYASSRIDVTKQVLKAIK